jgi:hypothetical protein
MAKPTPITIPTEPMGSIPETYLICIRREWELLLGHG